MTKVDERRTHYLLYYYYSKKIQKALNVRRRGKQNHRVANKHRRYFHIEHYMKNYKAITEDEHFFEL